MLETDTDKIVNATKNYLLELGIKLPDEWLKELGINVNLDSVYKQVGERIQAQFKELMDKYPKQKT